MDGAGKTALSTCKGGEGQHHKKRRAGKKRKSDKGGMNMKNRLSYSNKGSMEVKALKNEGNKKPTVRKGEDLRK